MTVIRPNSVSGITSITAQANEINFFRSNGALAGLQLNGVNFNTTTGVSTFNNLDVGGVLTYQDVTNIDSIGIITARSNIDCNGDLDVDGHTELDNVNIAGVVTSAYFVGSGAASLSPSGNADELVIGASNGARGITIFGATSNIFFGDSGDNDIGQIQYEHSDNSMRFNTNASERLRIDSVGKITTNTTQTIIADYNTSNSGGAYFQYDIGANGANIGYMGAASHLTSGGQNTDFGIRASNNLDIAVGGSSRKVYIYNSGNIQLNTTGTLAVDFNSSNGAGAYFNFDIGANGANIGYLGAASHLVSGAATADLGIRSTQNFVISTGGAIERLRIASNGAITHTGKSGAAANPAIDPLTSFVLNDGEARLQLCATNSGNNAAALILSNESKHFIIHQRGPSQSNNFEIGYLDNASPSDINNQATTYLRVTTDGYSKHTSGGGFDSYARAVQAHEFRQYQNSSTLWTSCTNSSQTWEVIRADSARSGTNAMNMITTTTGNLGDDQHRLIGNGDILCDGTAGAGAADYAEYFEWTDSNSSNEDRRGMTVVLVDGKVRKTTSSDSADNIIGVVSANPVVVGDAQWRHWQSKYLRDDYGNYIYEDHNQITWTDDNGVKHDYEDWNVPSDVTVPNVGVTTTTHDENGIKLQHQKLNPSYDASKTYIPRSERKEWDAIGMVGKLRIRKGQKTGTRWIKMRDISDTVEEWLVR